MPTARRGHLTLLLILGALLLALGWWRAGGATQPSASTYVEASLGQPMRVNPLTQHDTESERDLAALVFSGLMRLRADGMPEPELAERWEVTPDGLTYTFHLRNGVTWHDGAAFDASDVAFTIARIQSEGFTGAPALAAEWRDVQVFVADSLTVLMRLPEPAADFLARATVGLLPEHLAEEMDAPGGFETPRFDRDPVGTGPYRLASLDSRRAVLEHNTSYVLGTPAITRLEMRFAADQEALLRMVRSGNVDGALLPESLTADQVAQVAEEGGHAATPLHGDALTLLYINNSRGVLRDASLRRALAASVDAAAAIAHAGLAALPGQGLVPPGSWAYPDEEDTPAADASAAWAESGWTRGADGSRERDGQSLRLELVTNGEPDRLALAEAIATQLEAHGVAVDVVGAPAQRVIGEYLRPGQFDLALFGFDAGADPDPYPGWHTSQFEAGNVAWFSDPQADALLESARVTLDVEERRELYRLFLGRFAELGASRVVAYPQRAYLHPERLAGFTPRLLSTPAARFQDVHLWRLP